MEPSSNISSGSLIEPKHRNRKHSKKKTNESFNKTTLDPFLEAADKSLMTSGVGVEVNLSQPKHILRDTSILGLDSDEEMMSIHNIVEYKTLDRYSRKFKEIQDLFPPSLNILKIEQVFNPFLRLSFQLKRHFIYANVKPAKLFHGTKLKYVHNICTYNFNWRFNGSEKGHKYGQGVNFTPKPKFAMNFCEKNVDVKTVILADVLIIKKGVGNENLQVPPAGCDTTVREGNITFVKFCDAEFYPSYVIFFCKG